MQPCSKSCWAGSDWIHSSLADFVCSQPSGCWLPDTADSWVIHRAAVAQDQHSCLDFHWCLTLICDFGLAYLRSSSSFQRLWYWTLSFGHRDSSGCLGSYLLGSEVQKLYHQQTIRLRYPTTASSSIFVVVNYCCCTFVMNYLITDLSFCWIFPMFWWNSWDPSYSLWSSCSVADIGLQALQIATDLLDLDHSSGSSQMWHDGSFEPVGHHWLPNLHFGFEILWTALMHWWFDSVQHDFVCLVKCWGSSFCQLILVVLFILLYLLCSGSFAIWQPDLIPQMSGCRDRCGGWRGPTMFHR